MAGAGGGGRGGGGGSAGAQFAAERLAQRAAFFAKSGLSSSELRNVATVIRTCERHPSSLTFDIATPNPAPTFKCALVLPKANTAPSTDGPPRTVANKLEMYWLFKHRGVANPSFDAGARIDIDGQPFEIVSLSKALRYGTTVHAWKANVLPVGVLWPLIAELQELGGTTVRTNVPIAVWEGDQEQTKGRGMYDQISGEMPCDFLADVVGQRNRQLVVGDFVFRITAAMPHFGQPAVKLRLVRADDA